MPRITPGLAKNIIRRGLRTVVDPEPTKTQVAELWEFFGSACAYCGNPLRKSQRQGHVDHLIPTSGGGTNHISNRVLSCGTCNGDERLDQPWLEFLSEKVKDQSLLSERRRRIEAWMSCQWPTGPSAFDAALLERETERAVAAFDKAVVRLRRTRSET